MTICDIAITQFTDAANNRIWMLNGERNEGSNIWKMGGVAEVNTFTKIYLCFFGQYDYDAVPAVPPEPLFEMHAAASAASASGTTLSTWAPLAAVQVVGQRTKVLEVGW